jgi:hypothetical protein
MRVIGACSMLGWCLYSVLQVVLYECAFAALKYGLLHGAVGRSVKR